jgi:hypothetical protein
MLTVQQLQRKLAELLEATDHDVELVKMALDNAAQGNSSPLFFLEYNSDPP